MWSRASKAGHINFSCSPPVWVSRSRAAAVGVLLSIAGSNFTGFCFCRRRIVDVFMEHTSRVSFIVQFNWTTGLCKKVCLHLSSYIAPP